MLAGLRRAVLRGRRLGPLAEWRQGAIGVLVVVAAAATLLHLLPGRTDWVSLDSARIMVALAWLLVAGTFLGGVIYRFRRNDTGLWAALILLPPTALMYSLPLSYPTGGYELAQAWLSGG